MPLPTSLIDSLVSLSGPPLVPRLRLTIIWCHWDLGRVARGLKSCSSIVGTFLQEPLDQQFLFQQASDQQESLLSHQERCKAASGPFPGVWGLCVVWSRRTGLVSALVDRCPCWASQQLNGFDQFRPRNGSIFRGDPVRGVPQKPDNQSFVLPRGLWQVGTMKVWSALSYVANPLITSAPLLIHSRFTSNG